MSLKGVDENKVYSVEPSRKGLSQTEGKKKPVKFSIKKLLTIMNNSGTNFFKCVAQGVKNFNWKNRVTKGAIKPHKKPTVVQLPKNVPASRR